MAGGFIRAYGLNWYVDGVDWHAKELLGSRNANIGSYYLANMWEQTGIYVLHDDWGSYYVGQVARQPIGVRLWQHQQLTLPNQKKNPHYGKWTRFSWFGFNTLLVPKDDGVFRVKKLAKTALGKSTENIDDIEALLMLTLGTQRTGNKNKKKFTAADEWTQVWLEECESARAKALAQREQGRVPSLRAKSLHGAVE